VKIESDFIKLDSFLKVVNAVGSGGEAKLRIQEEEVRVNGVAETRRGRKLRPGDVVEIAGNRYLVE
jgi:ribosome-associated protein